MSPFGLRPFRQGLQDARERFLRAAQELFASTELLSLMKFRLVSAHRKMFGFEHWNLNRYIITLAKTLSGGIALRSIVRARDYQKLFRAWTVVSFTQHVCRNNLAMGATCAARSITTKTCREFARMGLAHGQDRYVARKSIRSSKKCGQRAHDGMNSTNPRN